MDVLATLLTADPRATTFATLAEFWARHEPDTACAPVDAAMLGGFSADRLGYAFAAGYEAALRALLGTARPLGLVSLCATEVGGAHPRAIETRLEFEGEGLRLHGRKRWSTMATDASELLVLASRGAAADGRKRLVLARVLARAPGVRIQRMPDAPFAPEIPHAEIAFDGVVVAEREVLPGDAWEAYVKPFRTVEDIHVHAALLGHAVALARRGGAGRGAIERLAALVLTVRALSTRDPRDAASHVALAGAIADTREAIEALAPTIAAMGGESASRWLRDRPLLDVASKARAQRAEVAFARLAEGS
jgi:alkylation response protein AidB-like acyl-CoA dehydrogenase